MWARTAVIASSCLLLNGCYLLQAAGGQVDVLRHSKPIPQVLADPDTSEATRSGLERVARAREFAVRELGLPASRSYQRYADLGRPFVVWNLVATPEFAVEPRRWCFPVAGCVAYRGYFKEQQARDMALRLATRGDDVAVGGVAAYSTLGHFPDPVFGSMLAWRDTRLVGTLFHELAHERLYFPGDSEINEAFASVVEAEGLRRWLAAAGRTADLRAYEAAEAREAEFAQLLRATRGELARLYGSGRPVAEMRIEKQRAFGRLKFAYEQLRRRWGGQTAYDAWFARSLNNAHLVAVATYRDCMPGLERELQAAGRDLPGFYARLETLRDASAGTRRQALCNDHSADRAGPPPVAVPR